MGSAWIGCVAPLPPVHAYGTVGAANGSPGERPRAPGAPSESEFAYTVRGGLNPLGFSRAYEDDPRVDLGLGYELEHMPVLDPTVFAHGPYAEVGFWPNLRPAIASRVGLRSFGELLFARDQAADTNLTGYGITGALAVEFTGSTDVGLWVRDKRPATFGHGRGAWGLFVSTSYRSVGEVPYWMIGIGVSVRGPISVADLATD